MIRNTKIREMVGTKSIHHHIQQQRIKWFGHLTRLSMHQYTNTPIHQHTNTPTYQYSNTPTHQYTNTPTYQYTNTPIQQYTNTPVQQYTNTPIHQHTNTPIHQYTNTPTHQYTNTPTHQYTTQLNVQTAQARLSGRKARGRPRKTWINGVKETLSLYNIPPAQAFRRAADRRLFLPTTPEVV